jgi:hypothetical protein
MIIHRGFFAKKIFIEGSTNSRARIRTDASNRFRTANGGSFLHHSGLPYMGYFFFTYADFPFFLFNKDVFGSAPCERGTRAKASRAGFCGSHGSTCSLMETAPALPIGAAEALRRCTRLVPAPGGAFAGALLNG